MEQKQIEAYFAGKEPELIQAVSRLVRIDSTVGEEKPGMPFGEGPARALDEALTIAAELGLPGENLEGYVGTIDLNGKDTILHILVHLDVVDPGSGWTITSAFAPKLVNGLLYGRGTDDDKGPAMAALYALKAVKDLGVPLKHNVRLIFGTDEETGFRDIHWYYGKYPYAPYTFSPDSGFPIINIEKGHYQPTFEANWPTETVSPRVLSFTGGSRVNVVPPAARATVTGLSLSQVQQACDQIGLEKGITFTLSQSGGDVEILCSGQSAHASTPEEGHNAQTALLALLTLLPLADCSSTRALHALHQRFPHGDCTGKALGIAQKDDASGHLTLAFTMMTLTDTGLAARFDCRTPLCGSDANIRSVTEQAMTAAGFSIRGEIDPPHYVPADSPFVRTLLQCFEQYTGLEGNCLPTGGGTYVHGIPGGVAFGATMPGFVSNLHGPDERVRVSDLMTATKIFTQVILNLCT